MNWPEFIGVIAVLIFTAVACTTTQEPLRRRVFLLEMRVQALAHRMDAADADQCPTGLDFE